MSDELKLCPACGALPCDQTQAPNPPMTTTPPDTREALEAALRAAVVHLDWLAAGVGCRNYAAIQRTANMGRQALSAPPAPSPSIEGDVREAARALDERLAQIGGCSNAHCMVFDPGGMRTNGGCKCLSDRMTATRVVHAYREFRKSLEALSRHRAVAEGAQ